MGKCQQCDSHVKARLRDDPGEGKEGGQGRFRLPGPTAPLQGRLALGHVLSGFPVEQRMWSSAEPSFVVQSMRTLDGQADASY